MSFLYIRRRPPKDIKYADILKGRLLALTIAAAAAVFGAKLAGELPGRLLSAICDDDA